MKADEDEYWCWTFKDGNLITEAGSITYTQHNDEIVAKLLETKELYQYS